ncbi:MAG: MaoC family dehydratase [Alphaproteobacteria bacterium]
MAPEGSVGRREPSIEELHGYYLEDLAVGMTAVFGKTVTEADLVMFAGVSGDTNPLHLDEEFASRTRFGGRIVHGMLTASLISTLIGTKLPGPGCIYISQDLRFRAPVRVGDTVETRATVTEIEADRRRVILKTECTVKGQTVLDGVAKILVPSRGEM